MCFVVEYVNVVASNVMYYLAVVTYLTSHRGHSVFLNVIVAVRHAKAKNQYEL